MMRPRGSRSSGSDCCAFNSALLRNACGASYLFPYRFFLYSTTATFFKPFLNSSVHNNNNINNESQSGKHIATLSHSIKKPTKTQTHALHLSFRWQRESVCVCVCERERERE